MNPLKEQYIVDRKGENTGVILPVKCYEQLLEDLHDLAVVAERRKETPISLEEMKRRLKKGIALCVLPEEQRDKEYPRKYGIIISPGPKKI